MKTLSKFVVDSEPVKRGSKTCGALQFEEEIFFDLSGSVSVADAVTSVPRNSGAASLDHTRTYCR